MKTNDAAAMVGAFIKIAQDAHAELVASMPNKATTMAQEEMELMHGTPREFAQACVNAIGEVSVTEARAAIFRYQTDWLKAS